MSCHDFWMMSFTPQLSFYTNVLGLTILHASACYHQSYVNTCIVMYMSCIVQILDKENKQILCTWHMSCI
jgi:hypothetical protein